MAAFESFALVDPGFAAWVVGLPRERRLVLESGVRPMILFLIFTLRDHCLVRGEKANSALPLPAMPKGAPQRPKSPIRISILG